MRKLISPENCTCWLPMFLPNINLQRKISWLEITSSCMAWLWGKLLYRFVAEKLLLHGMCVTMRHRLTRIENRTSGLRLTYRAGSSELFRGTIAPMGKWARGIIGSCCRWYFVRTETLRCRSRRLKRNWDLLRRRFFAAKWRNWRSFIMTERKTPFVNPFATTLLKKLALQIRRRNYFQMLTA